AVSRIADHVLIEQFQRPDIAGTGDDFHFRGAAAVIVADHGAAVFRFEGVFHPQQNVLLAQTGGGAGVNGFHPQVGQLVGHIVVGLTDGVDVIGTDQQWVGGAEVVFLVNNGFARAGNGGNAAEGHFAVATVKGAHQAFPALGVAGDDGHFTGKIDIG